MKTGQMTKKEYVTAATLGMIVFHDEIYDGKEPMKVVGIRESSLELEGDYSGGTHNVKQKDWMSLNGTFRLRKCCAEKSKPEGCQLHNIHCGYPDCEPYITNQ